MANEYVITIAVTLLYFVAIVGWGGLVCKLLRSTGSFWQELAACLVTGCSVMYALFLFLASIGYLHRVEVIVVIVIGILLSSAAIPRLNLNAGSAISSLKAWSRLDLLLGVVIGLYAVVQIVAGLTPLMFYDLQVYHFLAPAQFLESGSLSHIPWNVNTNTPLAMQFIVGMSLAVDASGQAAKWIFTLFGCITAVGIYEFIQPAGRRAALLATACVLCFPEFLLMQTLGAVDLAIAGLMILGALWARRAFSEGSWRLAILAGLAFGLAVGSRYQAIVHVSWIVAVLLIEAKWSRSPLPLWATIRGVGVMVSLVLVMLAPWLVRNYLHLGNPIFPLTPWNVLGEWSAAQAAIWNVAAFGPPFSALSSVQQVLAPVGALLLFPANGLFGTATIMAALIGVAVAKPQIRVASIIGLGGLVMWGFLHPVHDSAILRYNALSLVFLLAATGAVLASEWIPARAGVVIGVGLSLGSFVIAIMHVQSILPAAQSLIDPAARQAIHRTSVPSWQAMDYINQRFDPHHDKVLVIGETRAFWLSVPYIAPSAYNGPQLDQIFGGDSGPEAWNLEFSRLGLTHLLVSNSEIERWHRQYGYLNLSPAQTEKLNHWMQGLPKSFDDNRGNVVLSLRPVSGER
jgi:Dolichyl-phosphate-mannose-protein mannosyltransferase